MGELRSERTELGRYAQRGHHDRATVYAVLDAATICHVGFVRDGYPVVLPTIHARIDDVLYLHGSPLSGIVRAGATSPLCVTATIVDGYVLSRSAFGHSMNHRSVVVMGRARRVDDADEKLEALRVTVEHVIPGRWNELRPPYAKEVAATEVLALPITEASAKVRTGPPLDPEEDRDATVWAGVLPLRVVAGEPAADPALPPDVPVPPSVRDAIDRLR